MLDKIHEQNQSALYIIWLISRGELCLNDVTRRTGVCREDIRDVMRTGKTCDMDLWQIVALSNYFYQITKAAKNGTEQDFLLGRLYGSILYMDGLNGTNEIARTDARDFIINPTPNFEEAHFKLINGSFMSNQILDQFKAGNDRILDQLNFEMKDSYGELNSKEFIYGYQTANYELFCHTINYDVKKNLLM